MQTMQRLFFLWICSARLFFYKMPEARKVKTFCWVSAVYPVRYHAEKQEKQKHPREYAFLKKPFNSKVFKGALSIGESYWSN